MHFSKVFKTAAFAAVLPLLTTSCAYRADLNQGNIFDQEQVNQLAYGMSPAQVRYILGTPMVIDPYDNSRWYYVKFKREGWSDPEVSKIVLLFSGSVLVDMSGDYAKPATFGAGSVTAPANPDEEFELPK